MSTDELLDVFRQMTLMELAAFTTAFEEAFGVSAAAAAPVVASAAADGGAAVEVEEQTEFTVTLSAIGPNKVQVIKVVRVLTGLGLKEAKDLVEAAPKPVLEKADAAAAQAAKEKLAGAGAEVTVS